MDVLWCGEPIADMSHEQLIEIIGKLADALERERKEAVRQLRALKPA